MDKGKALQAVCVDREKSHRIRGKGESQHVFDAQKLTYWDANPIFSGENEYISNFLYNYSNIKEPH